MAYKLINGLVISTSNQTPQVMSGDVSGATSSTTVIKLQNHAVASTSPSDGYVLTWVAADGYWEPKGATGNVASATTSSLGIIQLSGDLNGNGTTSSVPRVGSINGATVPVAGSLTVGNILQVTGISALSYGPINLAGGSNYVTGVLPISNQAAQTLSGDVTGTTSFNTVVKLQGRSVASTAPTDGYVLTWVASNTDWEPKPAPVGFSAGGDLSGTATNQNVINIHGASVPIAGSLVTGNILQVNGSSSLTYGAVNLAGGINFVTGTLPTSNQASQNMGGDVTGTTAVSTVTKIQGRSVASTAPVDGYILAWSTTNNDWQPTIPPNIIFTNLSSLSSHPNPNNLIIAQVQSNLGYYLFDPLSALTADGKNIVSPPSGAGQWIRQRWGHDKWRNQATWFISDSTGNDENSGLDSAHPIKSYLEHAYRLGGGAGGVGSFNTNMSVTFLDATHPTSTDPLRAELIGTQNNNGDIPTYSVFGKRTIIHTGSLTSNAVNPTGSQGTLLTDTGVTWSTYETNILEFTSGNWNNASVIIQKDLGSHVARVTCPWNFNSNSQQTQSPVALSGSTYQIVSFTDLGLVTIDVINSPTSEDGVANPSYYNCAINGGNLTNASLLMACNECSIYSFIGLNSGARVRISGCSISGPSFIDQYVSGYFYLSGFTGSVTILSPDYLQYSTCEFEGGQIGQQGGYSNFSDCGIYNTTTTDILYVYEGGYLELVNPRGTNPSSTNGLLPFAGSTICSRGGNFTNLSCGGTDFLVDGSTTQIAPDGSGVVTLSTFAALNSAPFSSNFVSPMTGSGIINGEHPITVPAIHRRRKITSVNFAASPYTILSSDDYLAVTSAGGAVTLNLPASPVTGDAYEAKDTGGVAATNNITVSGNGHNIDGASTFIVNQNRGSIILTYTGSEWSIS